MADLERTYNVPLRKAWLKSPKYKRAKKAVNALKLFLAKHMKSDNVKIGRRANMEIWKDGIKNPPHHIQVKAVKDDEGVIRAELVGYEFEIVKKKEAKKPKTKLQEAAEKLAGTGKERAGKEEKVKGIEEKVEKIKEEKAEKAKEIQKEELKEIRKEPSEAEKLPAESTETKQAKAIDKDNIKSTAGKAKQKDKR
jgi:large subunit ribosomal protein L31e